jgi:putative endonuclease
MAFYVYILASERNGTVYVGMTDDLVKRVWQHRNDIIPGFTKRYGVKTLVWYEVHESRESAFLRERQIKKWNRDWKLKLFEQTNPTWRDCYDQIAVLPWIPAFAGMSGPFTSPLSIASPLL